MNIKDQVVSLELSKKLKELGFNQDGYFCWFKLLEDDSDYELSEQWQIDDYDRFEEISAFTVAELGDMLPDWNESVKRADKDWICIIRHKHSDINYHLFAENEANARAKMLIYLIENGYIKNE